MNLRSFLYVTILGLSSVARAATSSAPATAAEPAKKEGAGKPLMRCLYTPVASEKSSSLPTVILGFNFYLEKNNNNEIAVDTYQLTAANESVKQVGHAEVTGTLSDLQLAADSPFDFDLLLNSDINAASDGAKVTGVVQSLGLFNGSYYTQLSVECLKASAKKAVAN